MWRKLLSLPTLALVIPVSFTPLFPPPLFVGFPEPPKYFLRRCHWMKTKQLTTKISSKAACFLERWLFMEWMSRAIDKLPAWAKLMFWVLTVILSVYYIAQYGFWSFL